VVLLEKRSQNVGLNKAETIFGYRANQSS